jgi:hypothetical protein
LNIRSDRQAPELQVGFYQHTDVAAAWPLLAEWIELGCSRLSGELTPEWIHHLATEGLAWIFEVRGGDGKPQGVLVMEVRDWPSGERVAQILLLAGRDMHRWLHFLEDIEIHVKQHGISRIRFEGRFGWERALRAYKPVRTVMEKVL